MIILTNGTQVVDIVKTVEQVENGLKVTRYNDREVIYGIEGITQMIIDYIPDVDFTKLSEWDFINNTLIHSEKRIEIIV